MVRATTTTKLMAIGESKRVEKESSQRKLSCSSPCLERGKSALKCTSDADCAFE